MHFGVWADNDDIRWSFAYLLAIWFQYNTDFELYVSRRRPMSWNTIFNCHNNNRVIENESFEFFFVNNYCYYYRWSAVIVRLHNASTLWHKCMANVSAKSNNNAQTQNLICTMPSRCRPLILEVFLPLPPDFTAIKQKIRHSSDSAWTNCFLGRIIILIISFSFFAFLFW